jgi:hypothetical protein
LVGRALDEEHELAGLAAVRAALDARQRSWRRDVLISSILEALASKDGLTASELTGRVRKMWRTSCLTETLILDALEAAHGAELLEKRVLGKRTKWGLTPAARQEVDQDRAWTDFALEEFQKHLKERLDAELAEPIRDERVPGLAQIILEAIARASRETRDAVRQSSDLGTLRPIQFDAQAVVKHVMGKVQPKTVANAMVGASLAIIDPDEDFGTEMVRLLMVGQILHGLVVRKGTNKPLPSQGVRVVLDTSVLVDSVDDTVAARRVFDQLIEDSQAAGVRVVVPEHVISEWEGLWESAEAEMRARSHDQIQLASSGRIFIKNPILQSYLRLLELDPTLTWGRFVSTHRDIKTHLSAKGVDVGLRAEFTEMELVEVERSRARLMELSEDPKCPANRSPAAATTDAKTLVLLRRWRRRGNNSIPSAWFVASDTLTGRVYKEFHARDKFPLAITPESWLLFLSAQRGDAASSLADLAVVLSDAASRRAFLSIATGYTMADAFTMSQIISEQEAISPEDVRKAIQMELMEIIAEGRKGSRSNQLPLRRGIDVVRTRSERRDARAIRERKRAVEAQNKADMEVQEAWIEVEKLKEMNKQVVKRIEELESRRQRAQRFALAGLGNVLVFGLLAGLLHLDLVTLGHVAVFGVLSLAAIVESLKYAKGGRVQWRIAVLSVASAFLWTLASVAWQSFS